VWPDSECNGTARERLRVVGSAMCSMSNAQIGGGEPRWYARCNAVSYVSALTGVVAFQPR
jgi:hypothetical protein